MKHETLNEVMADKDFQVAAEKIDSVEELRNLISEYGVEMTNDEVAELCKQVDMYKTRLENGEISEEELSDVNGGILGGLLFLAGSALYAYGSVKFAWGCYKNYKKR